MARADEPASLKPLYRIAVFDKNRRQYTPGEPRMDENFEQGPESPFIGRASSVVRESLVLFLRN